MAPQRKILIAEPDLDAVRPVTKALRTRGYHVHYARDGSKALEVAVLRHPDLILFDEQCPLIEVRSFVQILQTNPRTSDIPVLVSTSGGLQLNGLRADVVRKPFDLDEVLSRVEQLCQRVEMARQLKGDGRQTEGGLAQLPLTDLLQILSVNHRTGRLVLSNGAEQGELALAVGRPINARIGRVEGEKALFRLVGWREGTFVFHPGPAADRALISRAMEDALMEGMRQTDERARLLATLPPLDQALALTPGAAELAEPTPATRELTLLMDGPRRLDELLDLAGSPDLELLAAVKTLLDAGCAQPVDMPASSQVELLAPAELHALKGRLMRGRPAHATSVVKLAVCGTGPKAGRWLLASLPQLVPTAPEPRALRSSFGTIGRIALDEGLCVDLVLVPPEEGTRPLWRPFFTSALGALVLETTAPVMSLARFCGFELKLPLLVVMGRAQGAPGSPTSVPPELRGAPAGVVAVYADLPTALRSLLLIALEPRGAAPEALARLLGGVG